MSLMLATEAFVQLPLVGKSEEAQHALLSEAGSRELLGAALQKFATSISQLNA
jgi:hypothetical protein